MLYFGTAVPCTAVAQRRGLSGALSCLLLLAGIGCGQIPGGAGPSDLTPGPGGGDGSAEDVSADAPPVISDLVWLPSAENPLAGVLSFRTDEPAVWSLVINDDASGILRQVTPDLPPSTEHFAPVLGLRAGTQTNVEVIVTAVNDLASTEVVAIETGPLPDDFPPLTWNGGSPAQMAPGYTLFSVMDWKNLLSYGLLLAVDAEGEVVWYHRSHLPLVQAMRSKEGTILSTIGESDGIIEVDMLGNQLHWWHPEDLELDGLHHALTQTPDGALVGLSTELRAVGGYPDGDGDTTHQVVGDVIVEFTRAGEVTHKWSLLDVLDPYHHNAAFDLPFWAPLYPEAPAPPKDWSHANAIQFEAADDSYIVSLANTDQVVKLDRATGEPIWILGQQGDFVLQPGGSWFSYPHGAEYTSDHKVLLYDDGVYKESRRSRLVEYRLAFSSAGTGAEATEIWSWDGGEVPFYCFSPADVDRLDNGNLLVLHGSLVGDPEGPPLGSGNSLSVRLEEINPNEPGHPVFSLTIGHPEDAGLGRYTSFAAARIPRLYPDSWTVVDEPASVPLPPCEVTCEDRECGFIDGCLCGQCPPWKACVDARCVEQDPCADQCLAANRSCGPIDAFCSCGDCGATEMCDEDGRCVETEVFCAPYCDGKECGVIGAFYLGQYCDCGSCPDGESCEYNGFICR